MRYMYLQNFQFAMKAAKKKMRESKNKWKKKEYETRYADTLYSSLSLFLSLNIQNFMYSLFVAWCYDDKFHLFKSECQKNEMLNRLKAMQLWYEKWYHSSLMFLISFPYTRIYILIEWFV